MDDYSSSNSDKVSQAEVPRLPHVLLVEDDDLVRASLARHLRKRGLCVFEAPSALHAFQLLDHETVDVLVTDLVMPGPGGMIILRLLAELSPTTWRVVLAGRITAECRTDPLVDLAIDKGDDALGIIEAILAVARRPPREP